MFLHFLLLITIFLAGCSPRNFIKREISSAQGLPLATQQFYDFVKSEKFTAHNCSTVLMEIYSDVFKIDARIFNKKEILQDSGKILNNLWRSRLEIGQRLKLWAEEANLDNDCVDAIRSTMRAIRFIEDYVGELYVVNSPETTIPALTGNAPYLLLNPHFGDSLDLKSGDLLLSRGAAYTSAAIARIADVDQQFSHLAILYIDENTQKKYVVEAHIEIGSVVTEFEKYQTDGKVRAAVFRNPNEKLAHLSAKRIFELVTRASNTGENIPYDFGMDGDDHKELFCSEVAAYAYEIGNKELMTKTLLIPRFPSKITMKNRDFLENIGVFKNIVFAPADMEVEPSFYLVAEWRNYSRIRDNNLQDAILTKIYEWMENENYTMRGDPLSYLAKNSLYYLRRWPLFSDLLKERLPLNMSKSAIGTMLKLNSISNTLYDWLDEKDKEYKNETGFRMTPKQLWESLEDFRLKDLSTYLAHKKWEQRNLWKDSMDRDPEPEHAKFHNDFRASN